LFDGFTNDQGLFKAGASAITLTLTGPQFIDDPSKPDSGAYYKYVIVPTISLDLVIPETDGFAINAPHDFYLVRGDVAVLDANQPATADRWYIWRWNDKSAALGSVTPRLASLQTGGQPVTSLSWGNMKASYASTTK
jgi:hypothetical protein